MFGKTYRYSLSTQLLLLVLWAGIGAAGSMFLSYLREIISDIYTYDVVYYPLAAILRGLTCTFYLVLGKIGYELFLKIKDVKHFSLILLIIFISCLFLSVFLSHNLKGVNFSLLNLGVQPYFSFVCGTTGSIMVIVLFYLLRNVFAFPVLQYIGRKSLIIMGTHMSLLLTLLVPRLLGKVIMVPDEQTLLYYLFGLFCVLLMIIIEIPIIKLFDGKLKPLISRTK